MTELQNLVKGLDELDNLLTQCMKCGMCQAGCPVFTETQHEGDVARGKIYLLEGLAGKMISDAKGVKNRMDKCLLCGTCAANCPSGVSAMEIFIKARLILTGYLGLSFVKKIILRSLLSRPHLFNGLMGIGEKFQGVFIKPAHEESGTFCAAMLTSLAGNRHFPALAKNPFRKIYPSLDSKTADSPLKVAFFPGCVVDKVYPNIGAASVKVLKHHHIDIYLPPNQGCCGIPALSSGDAKSYKKLFQHNIKLFGNQKFDYLITPCGTCTTTIKEIWPMMAKELMPEQQKAANELSLKTMDISQFLIDQVGVHLPEIGPDRKARVTYHDPCHLGKSLGVFSQPRDLIKANREVQFVEMKEANSCCGNGGSFNLQHYGLSSAIGRKKVDHIKEADVDIVSTGCPACMMQMTDILSQQNAPTKVQHVIEIYADALDG